MEVKFFDEQNEEGNEFERIRFTKLRNLPFPIVPLIHRSEKTRQSIFMSSTAQLDEMELRQILDPIARNSKRGFG